jgi:uncharacterized protein
MKVIDVLDAVLVIVAALNWGLFGTVRFDLVHALLGSTILSAIVYSLVGVAGVYQGLAWGATSKRACTVHA